MRVWISSPAHSLRRSGNDIVANKSVHEVTDADIMGINIPIVGGRAGTTILHVFSQDVAAAAIPRDQDPVLDEKVQDAGTVMNWTTIRAVTPVKNQWQCGS